MAFFEVGDEARVGFDGDDAAAFAEEVLGHFAVAGADFEPDVVGAEGQGGADAFADCGVREKMLSQPLARHSPLPCYVLVLVSRE